MKNFRKKLSVYVSAVFLLPVIASAQYFGEVDTLFGNALGFINNILIPFLFTLALLVFVYGMFKFFILGGDNEEERGKGKQLLMWAIIGFVLMISIWGIVNMLSDGIFGDFNDRVPDLPGTPTL